MIASVIFSILNLVITVAIPIILVWMALTLRSINKKLETQKENVNAQAYREQTPVAQPAGQATDQQKDFVPGS